MDIMSGDMLLAFPEYLKDYEVFKMKPRTGAGYDERYDKRKVEGYWSWRKQSKMDEQGGLRTPNHQATFWVRDHYLSNDVVVEQNDYVEVKGKIFVVVDDQDFSCEGGFYRLLMQRLAGPTDQQVRNPAAETTIRSDY